MKILSIRQPWSWLILHAGKDIENRDWNDRYPGMADARALVASGDYFLIHAGKGMTKDEYEDAIDTARHVGKIRPFPSGLTLPAFADLPRGGIVGRARLHRIVTAHTSPWFVGSIGLILRDDEPLPFRPMKGQLGFFDAPGESS